MTINQHISFLTYTLFTEQALQTMSIALRGDGKYELKAPLLNIGWRIRKHYFLVSSYVSYI